jgi:hypothetical protein
MVEGLVMGGAALFCALAGVGVEAELVGVPEGGDHEAWYLSQRIDGQWELPSFGCLELEGRD